MASMTTNGTTMAGLIESVPEYFKRTPTYPSMTADSNHPNQTVIIFSLKEKPGALAEMLKLFQERDVSLTHIESRPSKVHKGCYEFLVECDQIAKKDSIEEIITLLKENAESIVVHDFNSASKQNEESVPWFPSKISDIDKFANRVLSYGAELDADHPGFKDEVYRSRRKQFADIAFNYKHGEKIPVVDYTDEEINTWRVVYNELTRLYPTHACAEFNYIFPLLQQNCGYGPDRIPQLQEVGEKIPVVDYTDEEINTWRVVYNELTRLYPTHACAEFNYIFPLLQQNCGYGPDRIPQLQEVSDFLKNCTGFTLRPVADELETMLFLSLEPT
ncbi:putative phenylalanine-4-hydroxylase 1 [Toxocara canis]|uniref:phenylalanine 4-monooxygenase n=1 Tax=Toxocara canis TaxID=6265 RepID=A0A0B2VXC5_TOXCA|nr:putative phenylalanine-4-hydroxylase 1 [Toxocara canis]